MVRQLNGQRNRKPRARRYKQARVNTMAQPAGRQTQGLLSVLPARVAVFDMSICRANPPDV